MLGNDTTHLEPVALNELQSLPPALLRGLPLPTQLTVRLSGAFDIEFCVAGELLENRRAGFAPAEVEALACAVEHGRADATDVIGWAARKRSEPGFCLDLATALQGATAPAAFSWSLGRVLRELGATIVNGSVATPIEHTLLQAA